MQKRMTGRAGLSGLSGLTIALVLVLPSATIAAEHAIAGEATAQDRPTTASTVHPSAELPPELARVLTDYEKAWSARDAAGLARLFAEDGWVLSRDTPPKRGRAAIQQHYTGQGGPLSLRALAFQSDGRVGYILGAYAAAKGEPDIGKFTLTLRKDADGRWLIVSDMDNGNSPSR